VALKMLADGNEHFVTHKLGHPHQDQLRLCETFANGQHPYAAILSCADSRVPPEIVFDAGIGDLFVVRVAGNVADVDEIGTLEYGVEHLGINLIVVMGHTKCGAVTAVMEHAHVTPNVGKLVHHIEPAAEVARRQFPQLAGARLVEKAIRANVRHSIDDICAKSDLLRERLASGKLKIVGSVYDLHTGVVDWHEQPLMHGEQPAAPATPHGAGAEMIHSATPTKPTTQPATPKSSDHHSSAPHDADPHTTNAHADAHVPAAGHASAADGHGARSHGHGTAAHDAAAHGAPAHHATTTQPAAHAAAHAPRQDNFLALGGLAGGGAVASYALIHFTRSRRHA
jgi:carbonic anhydrase